MCVCIVYVCIVCVCLCVCARVHAHAHVRAHARTHAHKLLHAPVGGQLRVSSIALHLFFLETVFLMKSETYRPSQLGW